MTRLNLRRAGALLVALLTTMVGLLGMAAPAQAEAIHHSALYDSGWPRAASPGQSITYTAKFQNTTMVPDVLHFRATVTCYDKNDMYFDTSAAWKNVTVPPLNSKGGGGTITTTGTATIPSTCTFSSFMYGLTSYTASVGFDYGPQSSSKPTGSIPLNFNIFKVPFSKSNYGFNYPMLVTAPSYKSDVHHTLPQKFEAAFNKAGINIHDPAYLRWWCSVTGVKTNHQSNAYAYNKLWEDWFASNPSPTKAQILAYRLSIQGKFTYTC